MRMQMRTNKTKAYRDTYAEADADGKADADAS